MSSLDVLRAVKLLREHRERVTESREKAREFLIRSGILVKKGDRLSPPYR